MIDALYVSKTSGNYTDLLFTLGLASLADYAIKRTNKKQKIWIENEETCFRLQFTQPIDIEAIASLKYVDLFPPVCGRSTKLSPEAEKIAFNTVEEWNLLKRIRIEKTADVELLDPRTLNGCVLVQLRHDRNHNELWEQGRQLRNCFGELVAAIFHEFGNRKNLHAGSPYDRIAKRFQKQTGDKLPSDGSPVKIYIPTSVQGVSQAKASSNRPSPSDKEPWLKLWLCAKGFFEFAISERIKVSDDDYDVRVAALIPHRIFLSEYRALVKKIQTFSPGGSYGSAYFDAKLILEVTLGLIEMPGKIIHPSARILGAECASYQHKGQVFGVRSTFGLGIPKWIKFKPEDRLAWARMLWDHLRVVNSLTEPHQIEMRMLYQDFISGGSLDSFFEFQGRYAEHLVSELSKDRDPYLLSAQGLDLMFRAFDKHSRAI